MISGRKSYFATLDIFLAHWQLVNDELNGAGPFVTANGDGRARLQELRDGLAVITHGLDVWLTDKELARADLEKAKKSLISRAQQFRRWLRGMLAVDSVFLRVLPTFPVLTSSQEGFLAPMRELLDLWVAVEAEVGKVSLPGNYLLDSFVAELGGLLGRYQVLHQAGLEVALGMARRDGLQKEILAVLSLYRPGVEGLLPPGSALVKTIPLLWRPSRKRRKPEAGGTEPDAGAEVVAVGAEGS